MPWFQMLLPSLMQEMQDGARQNAAAVVTDCDVVHDGRDGRWSETE